MTRSPLRRPLADHLAALLADEDGSVTIEALLIFPLLCWAYLGTFVFFDGVHAQAVNVRTAYTVGDILSRETTPITPELVDSMYSLQGLLQGGDQPRRLRVTLFQYVQSTNSYRLIGPSMARGPGLAGLTTAQTVDSRQYPALKRPGVVAADSWLALAGPYDTQAAAQADCVTAAKVTGTFCLVAQPEPS